LLDCNPQTRFSTLAIPRGVWLVFYLSAAQGTTACSVDLMPTLSSPILCLICTTALMVVAVAAPIRFNWFVELQERQDFIKRALSDSQSLVLRQAIHL
jgi:hypothetical protein